MDGPRLNPSPEANAVPGSSSRGAAPDRVRQLGLSDAVSNRVLIWLEREQYLEERASLLELIARAVLVPRARQELEAAFSGALPMGTGGRRGRCGPGPNRMNAVIVRETVQSLAGCLLEKEAFRPVAVAYDTREHSRNLALVAANQLARNGFRVVLLDEPRPSPLLSFSVGLFDCVAGVMITASHNPPDENGIKLYGADGAQLAPSVTSRMRWAPPPDGLPLPGRSLGTVEMLGGERLSLEVDRPYISYVLGLRRSPQLAVPLKIVYSPLHGTGHHTLVPVLRQLGAELTTVGEQCTRDVKFSTVESPNPENPEAFRLGFEAAAKVKAPLVLATDPDADRVGVACRSREGQLEVLGGNEVCVLLMDYLLRHTADTDGALVLTTLVSSPLIGRLARQHGCTVEDQLPVGFKNLMSCRRQHSSKPLLFACEESLGYLTGERIRDKDAAVGALLMAECVAELSALGKTPFDRLHELWTEHGYHAELSMSLVLPGGSMPMTELMARARLTLPGRLGGLDVAPAAPDGAGKWPEALALQEPGAVLLELTNAGFLEPTSSLACRLVARPSGTEPKLKLYALARRSPPGSCEQLARDVTQVREHGRRALVALSEHIQALAQVRQGSEQRRESRAKAPSRLR